MSGSLLLAAAIGLAMACVYAWVGRTVRRRPVSPEARRARDLFAVWWYGLAATGSLGAAGLVLGAMGTTSLEVHLLRTHVSLLVLVVALGGLQYYLLYVFTGRRGLLGYVVTFYAAFYLFLLYLVTIAGPMGVEISAWRVRLVYLAPPEGAAVTVALALLLLPQTLTALGYLSLVFVVREPEARFRIVVVASALVVWFGSAYVVGLAGVGGSVAWQVGSRVVALAAALAVLVAFHPPKRLMRRWHPAGTRREVPL